MSNSPTPSGVIVAVLPCNELDETEKFYNRLGFSRLPTDCVISGKNDAYRILSNGQGGFLHLTAAVPGWLQPDTNPFGLYLYIENVDELAKEMRDDIIEPEAPEDKPWGMYEFAVSDPEGTLVRVGWPSRLRHS